MLKEKQICSFGKAFLSKKRFLVESRGFFYPGYTNTSYLYKNLHLYIFTIDGNEVEEKGQMCFEGAA